MKFYVTYYSPKDNKVHSKGYNDENVAKAHARTLKVLGYQAITIWGIEYEQMEN